MLTWLAERLPVDRRRAELRAVLDPTPAVVQRAELAAALVRVVSADEGREALGRALTEARGRTLEIIFVCERIAPALPPDLFPEALDLVRLLPAMYSPAQALGGLPAGCHARWRRRRSRWPPASPTPARVAGPLYAVAAAAAGRGLPVGTVTGRAALAAAAAQDRGQVVAVLRGLLADLPPAARAGAGAELADLLEVLRWWWS